MIFTMKAVVMSGYGSAEVFSLQEVPSPIPHEGEIRIRVKASGFNPVDWKIREGWYGGPPPKILGMDCSGIVDAVGPNTPQFDIGDEVYAMSFFRSSGGSYTQTSCRIGNLPTPKAPDLISKKQAHYWI
jgi:NADPH2:quinone reductase